MEPINILKIAMGIVFLYHGLNKNLYSFSKAFNIPIIIAGLVILAEVLGGLGYLLSIYYPQLTRLSSMAVIPVLLGAIFLVHLKNGFNFMNNGFEYQYVLLSIAVYLLLK